MPSDGPAMTEPVGLRPAIEHTTAAMQGLDPQQRTPWLFARCWLHVEELRSGRSTPAAAIADFTALPTDVPGRPHLAAVLVVALLSSGRMAAEPAMIDSAWNIAEVAAADPDPPADWAEARAALRALWLTRSLQVGRSGVDPRSVLAELDSLDAVVAGRNPWATVLAATRDAAELLRKRHGGDLRDSPPTPNLDEVIDVEPRSPQDVRRVILAVMGAAQNAVLRGDLRTALAEFDRAKALGHLLPAGDPLHAGLAEAASSIAAIRSMIDPSAAGPPRPSPSGAQADPIAELRIGAARTDLSPAQRALNLVELAMAEVAMAESHHQLAPLDAAVGHLRSAVELAPDDDPERGYYRVTLAGVLVRRHQIRDLNGMGSGSASRRDLGEAVAVLEQSRAVIVGPEHPQWTTYSQVLADAHRFAGRTQQALAAQLDGLRGHIWSVLLQSGAAAATRAARDAADDAVDLARAHLALRDPTGAARALDAGRGLVLQAAMRFGEVADRLEAVGENDLAGRWRAGTARGADHVPMDLRREVVSRIAVGGLPGRAVRLDPPDEHEVRAALARVGADVLVYLVPADATAGAAVLVAAHEGADQLDLPLLCADSVRPLRDYATVTAARGRRRDASRDMDLADDGDVDDLRGALQQLGEWAWSAVIGPVLDRIASAALAPPGRPPRIVLVPMGDLAQVPWHAAARRGYGRPRYAVEDAVFSYAVSARMFCDLAWASDVALTTDGLVVADPDTGGVAADLPSARREALAVRDGFYPQASLLGRTVDRRPAADGAGTVEQVRDWLATGSGTVLHVACHGEVCPGDGDDPTSYLVLAGGRRLAAEDLVAALTSRRARDLAVAVLALCHSGSTGRGADEAYSLATAFLAAGTRSVVSAMWAIPESPTSILMYLFHHFLRELPPADALRAAQLSMLQPGSELLRTVPEALRDMIGDPADLTAWAGFVHFGR